MLARFLSNTRGSAAPLMAVVAIPVLAAVGMAVDYTRANAARAAFQTSLDATALMLSREAAADAANPDHTVLQTHATDTFKAFTVPAMDPAFKYQQVIILLTDGLNTQDRWFNTDTDIDARQQIACDKLRDAKVDVYTIQVNTGGDPTSTLLQNCASDPAKFYLLTTADQITATFEKIGTNLTKLRVAQ
jgi:hypothetical protein